MRLDWGYQRCLAVASPSRICSIGSQGVRAGTGYLESVGFDRSQVALHLQRCWPVLSDWDQLVGRHHHPNAHLSAVLYLTGDGSGEEGVLRVHAPHQSNELVPGLVAGHGGPIASDHPLNSERGILLLRLACLCCFLPGLITACWRMAILNRFAARSVSIL